MKQKVIIYDPDRALWKHYQDLIDEAGGLVKDAYPDLRHMIFGKYVTTGDIEDAVPLDHALQRTIINDFFRYRLAIMGPGSMDARMCLYSRGPFETTLGLFSDHVIPYIQGYLERAEKDTGQPNP